jgi:hypothetical protein
VFVYTASMMVALSSEDIRYTVEPLLSLKRKQQGQITTRGFPTGLETLRKNSIHSGQLFAADTTHAYTAPRTKTRCCQSMNSNHDLSLF